MQLTNKKIFIISYEEWGGMMMSKQHYAVELAEMGNIVYFINHTDKRKRIKRGEVIIDKTEYKNLYSVRHRYFHPYFFKLKYPLLHQLCTTIYMSWFQKKIAITPDIVWNFDLGNHLPLQFFPKKAFKIYMPVDIGGKEEIDAAKQANVLISVTDELLERYATIDVPKLKVNHGVANHFINNQIEEPKSNKKINIGYSGSLVRSDIDFDYLLGLVNNYPNASFHFWGECNPEKSSIHLPQDISKNTKQSLEMLIKSSNVKMYGRVSPEALSLSLKNMDILLIAYTIKNDQNHHKVLEYLGSGKVIVSSYMSSYADKPTLIEMHPNPNNNKGLELIFNKVINDLQLYNNKESQSTRIAYAASNTYQGQIKKIEEFINNI